MRLWLIAGLVLVGCGGRSSLGTTGTSGDGATVAPDLDGSAPRQDGRRWPDQRVVPDRPSCLPIPAGQVEGYYEGGWKGTWSCPGQSSTTVSGNLSFKLYTEGSPESFGVIGDMSGKISPGIPFGSMIKGFMGCTSLSAELPEILVGSGAILYKLTGAMVGTFSPSPQGFPTGQWKAAEPSGKCQASGAWFAYRK